MALVRLGRFKTVYPIKFNYLSIGVEHTGASRVASQDDGNMSHIGHTHTATERAAEFRSREERITRGVKNLQDRALANRSEVAMILFRELHRPEHRLTSYLDAELVALELLGLVRMAQFFENGGC